jgi:hypothetical protein
METQNTLMSSSARRRKRFTPAEKDSILEAFEQSGLSAKVFCEQHGLCVATLASWRKRQQESDTPGFVCLDLPGPAADTAVIRFPNGLEFRVPLCVRPEVVSAWCAELYRVGSR